MAHKEDGMLVIYILIIGSVCLCPSVCATVSASISPLNSNLTQPYKYSDWAMNAIICPWCTGKSPMCIIVVLVVNCCRLNWRNWGELNLMCCTFVTLIFDTHFVWPPYVIGQAIYIFILWFLLLLSFFLFFPRLISAVGDWMSTILPLSTHGVALV